MFLRTILFLLIFSSYLVAGIENYFKKITDKNDYHNIKNVDFIYIINLDQRPEKLNRSLKQLEPYGIFPYRFSAVNGWELSLEAINDLGYRFRNNVGHGIMASWYPLDGNGELCHEKMHVPGRCYFSHCLAKGTIGILLSHLSILQDAYDSGYNTVWIMEDDIEALQNPNLVSLMIEKLDKLVGKKNWDILFTDKDTKGLDGKHIPCYSCAWRPFMPRGNNRFAIRKKIGDFIKTGARYGAYSYIIRRSGIEKILNFLKKRKFFLPYDMEYTLPKDIKLYTVTKDIVSHLTGGLTDNGIPGYQISMNITPLKNSINNAEEITEEFLIKEGEKKGYLDYIAHLKMLFDNLEVTTFLEFGLSPSTKYFMDNSKKVISIEFFSHWFDPSWMKRYINLYKYYDNWSPVIYLFKKHKNSDWIPYKYFGSQKVYDAASYQIKCYTTNHKSVSPRYLNDLNNFIKKQIKGHLVDVAFIDAVFPLRGDIVQLLFNKVPIIIAHDIACKKLRKDNPKDIYGYNRIIVPRNYAEIYIPFGEGTAFWIKKENQYLRFIEILNEYSKTYNHDG